MGHHMVAGAEYGLVINIHNADFIASFFHRLYTGIDTHSAGSGYNDPLLAGHGWMLAETFKVITNFSDGERNESFSFGLDFFSNSFVIEIERHSKLF